MTYARNTIVSAIRTRNEIEETLERYGADGFAYAGPGAIWQPSSSPWRTAAFASSWSCPILRTSGTPTTELRPGSAAQELSREAHDQACRQRWRALLLVIKAKLEAVTAGISTIETEFLANIVLPDNTTAGEWMLPQIDRAYRTGEMPPLLPAAGNSGSRPTGPIPLPPA